MTAKHPSGPQRLYVVHVERIGRRSAYGLADTDIAMSAFDAQDLADQIYRLAGKHLASRDYVVTVDLDPLEEGGNGRFSVGFGRFGNGTIEDRGEFEQ